MSTDTKFPTLSEADLEALLNTPDSPGKITLHYYPIAAPTRPALCGATPAGGSWVNEYRPHEHILRSGRTALQQYPSEFVICPACKVRYSYIKRGQV